MSLTALILMTLRFDRHRQEKTPKNIRQVPMQDIDDAMTPLFSKPDRITTL